MEKPVMVIVQARVGSTRLPGKVMMQMAGMPMIELLLRRLMRSKHASGIILATGDRPANQPLAEIASSVGVNFFAGDEDDVLDRYIKAAEQYSAHSIVRVTGDNPLTSPLWMDRLIKHALGNEFDYCRTGTLPIGCGCEWVTLEALKRSASETDEKQYREHVTLWIRHGKGRYKAAVLAGNGGGEISVTVDTTEEFDRVHSLIESTSMDPELIEVDDIIRFSGKKLYP